MTVVSELPCLDANEPASDGSFDRPIGDSASRLPIYSNSESGGDGKNEFSEFGELYSVHSPREIDFTILTNNQGHATKVFHLDGVGQLQKRSAANIYEGQAERVTVSGLTELRKVIAGLLTSQALCFGVAKLTKARLLTQETLRSGSYSDAIARDRDHFTFRPGQPGILMMDFDHEKGQPVRGWHDLDQIIGGIIPSWRETQRLWRASSSAYLYRSDGTELIGIGGWRCYVVIDDASAIPSVGAFIYQKLWDSGYGFITISKSGQLLDRSLIDASVWQPERVDFAAEPVLEGNGDIVRNAPEPTLLDGAPYLAASGLKEKLTLPEWRRKSDILLKAKDESKPESVKVRQAYLAQRLVALKETHQKTSEKQLRKLLDSATEKHILSNEFVLYRLDGSSITVGEILADPAKWHQARFADPLEPDYRDDKRIAYANLEPSSGCDPYIWSHAHGGQCFRLIRESAELTLRKGDRPRVLDACLEVVRGRGELYERGGQLVRVASDSVHPVSDIWLSDYLGRNISFSTISQRGSNVVEIAADPPTWLCQQINAKSGERGMRELNGIITAPTLRPDGSLLCTPGYDETTGLLLRGSGWPRIPERPTKEEMKAAFTELWRPFAEFPFVSKEDKGVMVACILTGIVRRSLPCAPAFSFDAPSAGSGKTLLARCAMQICGSTATVIPPCEKDEELRKLLLAYLLEGRPAILLDNIKGQFRSSALEAFLTSEYFSDRILGFSKTSGSLPTNVLFLISGNNFRPNGDLYRRILTTRIDAQDDSPERRCFALEPLRYCLHHRQALVAAGLTLMLGFVAAGKPRSTPDRLASFEGWDDLVRQSVLWLAKEGIAELGDPTTCIDSAKEQEPERQKLATFLEAAANTMPIDWRVADLIRESASDKNTWLREAIEEIAAERGAINPRILGRWIERHAGTRCAGFYLERRGSKQRAVVWRICRYSQVHKNKPSWPENNSPNSPNSLLDGF